MRNRRTRRSKGHPLLYGFLGVLITALVVGRIMLPSILKSKVNELLGTLPDYTGNVERVHVALWRGALVLEDLTLKHRHGDFSLTIKSAGVRLVWHALLRRMIVADFSVQSPRVRMLVERPAKAVKKTKEKTQEVKKVIHEKTGQSLPDLLAGLIPFRINTFSLTDGSVRVRENGQSIDEEAAKDKAKESDSAEGQEKEAGLEARLSDIEIEVNNLTNTTKETGTLEAKGKASAKIMNHGTVLLNLRINPIAKTPEFYTGLEINDLDLTALNPILSWQWGIDAKKGTFELFSEAAAKDGRFKGYVKPLIRDLKMVDLKKDKNPVKIVKEAVVGAVASVFTNKKKDQVATKVPFEGQFDNPHPGIWEAILQVLRNAFIEALKPRLDRDIKIPPHD